MDQAKVNYIWGLLRLGMGWIFLWGFLDKLFGLGFATTPDKSWLSGASPTSGFLTFATKGPLYQIFQSMAGNAVVDWLFMLGLLAVGLTLVLGVMVRLGSYSGILMLALIYLAGFLPPANNPFLDQHIIYILIMIGLTWSNAGQCLGFGRKWSKIKWVQKYPILQ